MEEEGNSVRVLKCYEVALHLDKDEGVKRLVAEMKETMGDLAGFLTENKSIYISQRDPRQSVPHQKTESPIDEKIERAQISGGIFRNKDFIHRVIDGLYVETEPQISRSEYAGIEEMYLLQDDGSLLDITFEGTGEGYHGKVHSISARTEIRIYGTNAKLLGNTFEDMLKVREIDRKKWHSRAAAWNATHA